MLFVSLTFSGCGGDKYDSDYEFIVSSSAGVAGTNKSYTYGSLVFNMIAATASSVSSITFPAGTDDSGTATISTPFMISETPVTYELWEAVYRWATANGYTFANAGLMGSSGGGKRTAARDKYQLA